MAVCVKYEHRVLVVHGFSVCVVELCPVGLKGGNGANSIVTILVGSILSTSTYDVTM